jgi:hypothetical protein
MRTKTKSGIAAETMNCTDLNLMALKLKKAAGEIPKSTPAMTRSKAETQKSAQSSKGRSSLYST